MVALKDSSRLRRGLAFFLGVSLTAGMAVYDACAREFDNLWSSPTVKSADKSPTASTLLEGWMQRDLLPPSSPFARHAGVSAEKSRVSRRAKANDVLPFWETREALTPRGNSLAEFLSKPADLFSSNTLGFGAHQN